MTLEENKDNFQKKTYVFVGLLRNICVWNACMYIYYTGARRHQRADGSKKLHIASLRWTLSFILLSIAGPCVGVCYTMKLLKAAQAKGHSRPKVRKISKGTMYFR